MDKNKIIERLRKLKALYEGANSIGSEAEAANTAAKMHRIMVEYNISLNDITEEELRNTIVHRWQPTCLYPSIGGKWQEALYIILCSFNMCSAYFQRGRRGEILIVGSKNNVDNVIWLFKTLSFKMVELSKVRWKELEKKTCSKDKFQRDYLMGFAHGIADRMKLENEEVVSEHGRVVNDIVLRNQTAIIDYLKTELDFHISGHKTCDFLCNENVDMGYKDGKELDLQAESISKSREQLGFSDI